MEPNISRHRLCAFCCGINLEDLKSKDGYMHQPTCDALITSADTCDLCHLIRNLFKRCIYEQRFASSHIRTIDDARYLGPVRLFGASRELDFRKHKFQRRERGSGGENLLSQRVAVTFVIDDTDLHYGPEFPTLLMFTDPGSFAESKGVVGLSASARGIQDDHLCNANISRILSWTTECERAHMSCNTSLPGLNIGDKVAPGRLIDTGFLGQSKIRLTSTNGLPARTKYVALSYCWGRRHTGERTTNQSIGRMMEGIPIAELSQTIQDAVRVVRELRIQYLWIDALCIIQEQPDKADWIHESKKMGQIYTNAFLTIAATSASEAAQGFLVHSNRSGIPINFKLHKNSTVEGEIFFRECTSLFSSFREDVEDSPLLRRAWVKQERILSRRTVDFSSKQIYWTCRTIRHSEDGQNDSEGAMEAAALLQAPTALAMSLRMDWAFFGAWADLVQTYSTLELTHESDRLPALDGIADVSKQVVPGRYLSGIWEANLSPGLLWEAAEHPAKPSPETCVSSWSWASVFGPVLVGGHDQAASQVQLLNTTFDERGRQILHLQGRVHQCAVDVEERPPSPLCRSDRKLKDPRTEVPSYSFRLTAAVGPRPPGARFENTSKFDGVRGVGSEFYVLGLQRSTHAGVDCHNGLLLRRLDKSGGEYFYERIGRVWSSDPFWYAVGVSWLSLI